MEITLEEGTSARAEGRTQESKNQENTKTPRYVIESFRKSDYRR